MYEEDKDRNWNREPEEERPKREAFKEGSLDHSGALLFGTIAGGVMVGVQIASPAFLRICMPLFQGNRKQGTGRRPKGKSLRQIRSPGPKLRRRLISLLRLQMCLSSWRRQCLR